MDDSVPNRISDGLSAVAEHLNKRQEVLQTAQALAQETDAILSESEDDLRAWLKAVSNQ
jgi:hypothetical protein